MIRKPLFLPALLLLTFVTSANLATAQTLTINGVSSGVNGAIAEVPLGGLMALEITDDVSNVGAGYTVGLSFAVNARTTGWWLEDFSLGSIFAPITLVAGVPTNAIESTFTYQNGSPVDMKPNRAGSPQIRLTLSDDGSEARALQLYRLPYLLALVGNSIYFQVTVTDSSGLSVTNGVRVLVTGFVPEASLEVVRGADRDDLGIGNLSFTGAPGGATFTADATLDGTYEVLDLVLPGIQFLSSGIQNNVESQPDAMSYKSVARALDNREFMHVAIPAAGTVPPRDLYHVRDFDNDLFGWIVVNHGDNPNVASRVFAPVDGLVENTLALTQNPWEPEVLISPDYTHALVSYELSGGVVQVFLMAIDGRTPYSGGTSAMREVTPSPAQDTADIDSSYFANTLVVLAYADGFGGNNMPKRLWAVPYPGLGAAIEIPYEDVASNPGSPIISFPTFNSTGSRNKSTVAFTAGTSDTQREMYAIDTRVVPVVARNVSGFPSQTRVAVAGDAIDGDDGRIALSPNGLWVAFTLEVSSTDHDLYVARTNGANAGNPILVTPPSLFDDVDLTSLIDIYWADNDTLLFWMGKSGTGATAGRDLFRYSVSGDSYLNLTMTPSDGTQEPSPPYTKNGTIQGKGMFVTSSNDLLVFVRENGPDSGGTRNAVNLAGVDLDSYDVFDLTGSEFSGGFSPEIKGPDSSPEGRDYMIRSSPGNNGFYWFTSALIDGTNIFSNQAFVFDSRFPVAAFPVTSFATTGSNTFIENFAPAKGSPSAGFTRRLDESGLNVSVIFSDVRTGLVSELRSSVAVAEQSLRMIDGGTGLNPAFVYAFGTTPGNIPNVDTQIDYVEITGDGILNPIQVGTIGGAEFLGILSATRD